LKIIFIPIYQQEREPICNDCWAKRDSYEKWEHGFIRPDFNEETSSEYDTKQLHYMDDPEYVPYSALTKLEKLEAYEMNPHHTASHGISAWTLDQAIKCVKRYDRCPYKMLELKINLDNLVVVKIQVKSDVREHLSYVKLTKIF